MIQSIGEKVTWQDVNGIERSGEVVEIMITYKARTEDGMVYFVSRKVTGNKGEGQ